MNTSDGISESDWDVIRGCAEAIVAASADDVDDSLLVANLLRELDRLEVVYGRLPSILATKADYVEDNTQKLVLLKESYVTACEINDLKNKSYISAALAEYYVEDLFNAQLARYWLQELRRDLNLHWGDYLESVYIEVSNAIEATNKSLEPE